MSKRTARQRKKQQPARMRQRRWLIGLISLTLCLIVTGGIFSKWRSIGNAPQPASPSLAPPGLAANNPSKEYIYAGGRLIATEEPSAAATPTPTPSPTPPGGNLTVQDVWWINISSNAQATGNTLTKNAGTGNDWNAGAVSAQSIVSGDGYVEFTANSTSTYRMGGLSGGTGAGYHFNDIDFAFYLNADGYLYIFENGTPFFPNPAVQYTAGDKVRIAIEGGKIRYWLLRATAPPPPQQQQQLIREITNPTLNYPLLVDASIYSPATSLNNAVIAGAVLNSPPPPPTTEDVVWTNKVGATATGNTLSKSGSTSDWDAGAVSTRGLASGNGSVEFTASQWDSYKMCGLSRGDSNQHHSDIDYALYVNADHVAYVFESGVPKGTGTPYVVGDHFIVAVENGTVKYKKNGAVFYTSLVTPTYPLIVDTSLYSTGAAIADAKITGNLQTVFQQSENVSWTNLVGVTASGNSLSKTFTIGAWDAGAVSNKAISSGDGFVEFTATEWDKYRMCGLGRGDTNQHHSDIDFALYINADHYVYVFESGESKGMVTSYVEGDRFSISIEGGVVRYKKNGVVIYTSLVSPLYPLLVDTSLYSANSTITNVVISGALQSAP